MIIVLDKNNELSIVELYTMGFLPSAEYKELLKKITSSEKVDIETAKLSYEDICKHPIYILPASDSYVKNENGLYEKVTSQEELPALVNEKGLKLKITGIIRPKEDNDSQLIKTSVGYTKALTDYLIEYAENSEIVRAQKENKEINVVSGMRFDPKDDDDKVDDVINYFRNMGQITYGKCSGCFAVS